MCRSYVFLKTHTSPSCQCVLILNDSWHLFSSKNVWDTGKNDRRCKWLIFLLKSFSQASRMWLILLKLWEKWRTSEKLKADFQSSRQIHLSLYLWFFSQFSWELPSSVCKHSGCKRMYPDPSIHSTSRLAISHINLISVFSRPVFISALTYHWICLTQLTELSTQRPESHVPFNALTVLTMVSII